MITYKQLTLAEIFEDCQNKFDNDKQQFLSLLDEAINLDEIVPVSFVNHFHATTNDLIMCCCFFGIQFYQFSVFSD